MRLAQPQVCRRWPPEVVKSLGADLNTMPGLTLAFIAVREPDYVQQVLQREGRAGGAGSSRWLAPILVHNQSIAQQLVRGRGGGRGAALQRLTDSTLPALP